MPTTKNLTAAIYFHPEGYPPTLNALGELAPLVEHIDLVYRPHMPDQWKYPENVRLRPAGPHITTKEQEQLNAFKKLTIFFKFTLTLYHTIIQNKPQVVLIYDTIALLSYRIVSSLITYKPFLWYHNHDVTETELLKPYTLSSFAYKNEQKFLQNVNLFTLPTLQRLPFFNMHLFNGKCIEVPNFPSQKFYNSFLIKKQKNTQQIKLIFQGRISEGHGLEEIIPLLGKKINGKTLCLELKGIAEESYKQYLISLAELQNNRAHLHFHPYTTYSKVPELSTSCDIGIAIFRKRDVMNNTLGKASNKVYEYIASGLPVIYSYDTTIADVLKEYEWAAGCNLSNDSSILNAITQIESNYSKYSESALKDHNEKLNFETAFTPCIELIANVYA